MSAAGHYRALAGPVLPTRPVLTWWQRAMVRVLPAEALAGRRWYRAHVGGRWSRVGVWAKYEACPGTADIMRRVLRGLSVGR